MDKLAYCRALEPGKPGSKPSLRAFSHRRSRRCCRGNSEQPLSSLLRGRAQKTRHQWDSSLISCGSYVCIVARNHIMSGEHGDIVVSHAFSLLPKAANLLHRSPENQKQVLAAKGVAVYLSCFLHDDHHPLMRGELRCDVGKPGEIGSNSRRAQAVEVMTGLVHMPFIHLFCVEWAVMAVRNLCEGNAEAQAEIASYQRQPEAAAAAATPDAQESLSRAESVSCCAPFRRRVMLGIFVFYIFATLHRTSFCDNIYTIITYAQELEREIGSIRIEIDEMTGLARPAPGPQ